MLNAVSATWARLRRPILVAFYDTHEDTEDTFSTFKPRVPAGVHIMNYIIIYYVIYSYDIETIIFNRKFFSKVEGGDMYVLTLIHI